jgi:hypothetical protein
MNLIQLIQKLEKVSQDKPVVFDYPGLETGDFDSSDVCENSLFLDSKFKNPERAGDFLCMCKNSLNYVFDADTAYEKIGAEFEQIDCWYSEAGNRQIVNVKEKEHCVVLMTQWFE